MAHEIDTTTGRAAVFTTHSSGGPPWHGLGQTIDSATTSRQAIGLAGLDWTVEQWPVTASDPRTGQNAPAGNHVANVRIDTGAVLGVVGTGYHVFQNRDAFDFMDAIVGDKLAMYETAGSLKGGRRIWMLARIPSEYRAGPEDLIKPYVLLVNSHDGSTALRVIPTTVRVVCQNTLNLALHGASSGTSRNNGAGTGLTIRHRPNLDARVREARLKLGVVAARFDRFDAELHAMLARELRPQQVTGYFQSRLPRAHSDRQRRNQKLILDRLHDNFENDTNTLPGVRHTAWAAYNAVSQWADHQRTFRGDNDQLRAESRLNSVWFGSSHQIKHRAYHAALAMAGN